MSNLFQTFYMCSRYDGDASHFAAKLHKYARRFAHTINKNSIGVLFAKSFPLLLFRSENHLVVRERFFQRPILPGSALVMESPRIAKNFARFQSRSARMGSRRGKAGGTNGGGKAGQRSRISRKLLFSLLLKNELTHALIYTSPLSAPQQLPLFVVRAHRTK